MDKIKRDELAAEECVRRYQRICPEQVLTDYKGYKSEIKQLNAELKAVLELSAVGNSEVHTANISDPTGDTAVKRVDLAMQIAVLEKMGALVEAALRDLSELHQNVLDLFFFKRGLMGYNVQEFADEHFMSVAGVYRERRIALNEFAEIYEAALGISRN